MSKRTAHLVGLSLLLPVSCTDVDLYIPIDPDNPSMRQQIVGDVCAPEPLVDFVPYKILFVVDTSGSNSWTDPTPPGGLPRREKAVRDAIDTYLPQPNVYFGIITFSDEARRQTFGFTRNSEILEGATANIGHAQGGTNYSDALWSAIDLVSADLSQMDASEKTRTQYRLFWLSDGYPTVGVTTTESILPGVTYLADLVQSQGASFALSTAFLGGGPEPTTEQEREILASAKDLLSAMANVGNGSFVDIPDGQEVQFDIDVTPVQRNYVLRYWLVSNRNVFLGGDRPVPDSDGDGLPDELEIETDSAMADTDGDGLNDAVELSASNVLDPTVWDDLCATGRNDTDGDGLADCEEALIGTNPNDPDSDDDYLPDGVEFRFKTSPLSKDPGTDADADGLADDLEVRLHLDPQVPNAAGDVDRWAYQYETESAFDAANDDRLCYQVVSSNMVLFETQSSATREAGTNVFELYLTFETEDGVGPRVVYRTEIHSTFLLPDYRDPASGRSFFGGTDLTTWSK